MDYVLVAPAARLAFVVLLICENDIHTRTSTVEEGKRRLPAAQGSQSSFLDVYEYVCVTCASKSSRFPACCVVFHIAIDRPNPWLEFVCYYMTTIRQQKWLWWWWWRCSAVQVKVKRNEIYICGRRTATQTVCTGGHTTAFSTVDLVHRGEICVSTLCTIIKQCICLVWEFRVDSF